MDDVSYAWKNYPLYTHFFGEKKGTSMQATAYCFWIRQLQLRLGGDQRSRTGGLEMWSNPRWISDQELKKFQNDRCAINNYMVHGTAIKDATNKFSN